MDPGGGENGGGEEDEEPAVRSGEEAPEAVEDGVREALALVARKGTAEAVELEREPRPGRREGAGGRAEEAPRPQRRGREEREEEERRDDDEARLQEEGRAGGETGPEGPPAGGPAVLRAGGAEGEGESAAELLSGPPRIARSF